MSRVYDLAPPRNWQDFEDLCRDLFRKLWDAPGAQKNGRAGQPQAGVDVFGLPTGQGEWFGVQCKKKLGTEVTEAELKAEVEKAKRFNPTLARFVLATTARCDQAIQKIARALTEKAPFEVTVYDWDHFCADLAGRPQLLQKHFPDHFASDPSDLQSHYLRHLLSELDVVDISKVSRSQKGDILLSAVYTELDVTAKIDVESEHGELVALKGELDRLAWIGLRAEKERQRTGVERFSRRYTALEAVAAARLRVLVGRGGSGKSTFGRYLCLCLAGERLGHDALNLRHLNGSWADEEPALRPWPHGDLMPFFVALRRFVRSTACFPDERQEGQARHLVDYLATCGPHEAEMGKIVREALDAGALVVLDGLDETPAAEDTRERIQQIIQRFVETYPRCRVLVTSRPYAYEPNQPWRLDDAGFLEETLAPFDDAKIERFVTDAYAAFADRNRLADEDLKSLAGDLLGQIREQSTLQPLAEQPLMLTMMIDLHTARGGRLPAARSTLFEESVVLLFDRWNERRHHESVASLVGMNEEQIRAALELLAFRVHRDAGADTDQPANVSESSLFRALLDTRKRYGNQAAMVPEEIRDYLNQRSGILIAESPSRYQFPHRFFQEYLAACFLEENAQKRKICFAEDPLLWREAILFLAGRLTKGDRIWTLIRELVPEPPPADVAPKDRGFAQALLAGLAIREHRLWEREEKDHQPKLDDVRDWLRRSLEIGALSVKDRVQAGQVLSLLGDHRPGVSLGPDGLPSFEWVEIPKGTFIMGGEGKYDGKPQYEAHVDGYRISRYPVTNAQYQVFIADGGYTERFRSCWTDAGWEDKGGRDGPRSVGHPFDLPNHPRVYISWYEAVAFCRWLSEQTGEAIRLPNEAEWERAARGTDGRVYPWGSEFDPAKCNVTQSGIGTTSAVGLFPEGSSPEGTSGLGILDASGNTWEWCSTKHRERYDEAADDDLEGSAVRVVRGGSFAYDFIGVRCASRFRFDPDGLNWFFGFRLVAPFEYL